VAENQPNKNRMNKEFSDFAARLREAMSSEGRVPRGPNFQMRKWDSCNSSLPDFNSLALELFRLQHGHNAAYRRICEASGLTPDGVEHWIQIPGVPTAAFKELELSCIPPKERTAVFHSSGTTEQKPSRHFHSAESLAVYEASLWPWFQRHVVPEFGVQSLEFSVLILTPPPAQAPRSSLVHMLETIRKKLGASRSAFVGKLVADGSWAVDFDVVLSVLGGHSKFKTQNSKLIVGTAFSFVHLLDYLAEHSLRFRLPPGSRVMETGGYKNRSRAMPKAELHALITERLGIPRQNIVCEYGMSELSSQAYSVTCDEWQVTSQPDTTCHSSLITHHFHFPPWARVQIISPETGLEVADGGTGLIRIFDLANVFSVAAIQTEDLGIRCGDGFELIGRAQMAELRGCSLMSA
jgi:Acyl-protein synthetase, LuxE